MGELFRSRSVCLGKVSCWTVCYLQMVCVPRGLWGGSVCMPNFLIGSAAVYKALKRVSGCCAPQL